MSNVNMGWRGTATAAYGITTGNLFTSTAFGVDDTDSGKFKIQSLTTVGAVPTGTVQLTIDPSTNGNITLNPNGTGVTALTTNLTLPTSNTALTQGIITIGAGNRWISAIGTQNTFVGQGSGSTSITSAQENVGIGTSALGLLTSGSNNSCIGWGSGIKMTSAGDNVSIGAGSLNNLLTGNFNIALGTNSGNQYKGAETYNILLGSTGVTGDSGVMRLGNSQTVSTYLAGAYGNAPASSQFLTVNSSGQLGSTAGGGGASSFVSESGTATESGASINIYGDGQAIGTSATGSTVTIAMYSDPYISGTLETGSSITIDSGSLMLPATDQAGNGAIYSFGIPVAVWDSTLNSTFYGISTGNYGSITGTYNTGIGLTALSNATTASYNTAVGNALSQLSGGNHNCAFGYNAGYNYSTGAETNNIVIGYNVMGTASENNTIRIGNSSATATYITGISGATVTGSAVLCSATGQLGTVASSRRYKDGIKDMGKDSHNLMGLRPVTFHYKGDPSKTKSYGLIAEEVQDVMPSLVVLDDEGRPDSVKYHEMPAILLNEIQKLQKRIEQLEKKLL